MNDDDRKRLTKALEEVMTKISSEPPPVKTERMPDHDEYFKKLRALKDKRRADYNEVSDEKYQEMLDTKERILDMSEEGLSNEDKERIAEENYRKKKLKKGIIE